ncbi:YgfZ/GcvT domain-containing protein [Candidatus Methylocalor cossyra]|uniref:Folate-dependent protein for Fe/S cluster synthesis/repair in oxidative stress n=1 Tax=Candidatus Methylocalor cossyra TaxID=3108543 RepID=A0ABP1C8I8_9GAMM
MATFETLAPQAASTAVPPPAEASWRALLEQSGARLEEGSVVDFGRGEEERRLALKSEVLADLSHLGLIEVRGEDAQKFLANLFTGDVRLVSPERGMFTSWCDAKGRAQATFWLLMRDGAYLLVLPRERVPSVLAGLKRYQLRTKVTLTDRSGELPLIGLAGPGMADRLSAALGAAPPGEVGETGAYGGCTLMAIHGQPHRRWLGLGEAKAVAGLWRSLLPGASPVGREAWSLLDILAGIPLLVGETSGEFIPQMLNMEALGGLSFSKGCYPGQEVIARLHYRGQLKRRLYLAFVSSDRVPAPGTSLEGEGLTESVGTVLAAARHPDGRVALLGVLKIEEKGRGPVHLGDAQGPVLAFVEES